MVELRRPLMKKMLKSKKGFDFYAVIVAIVGLWVLGYVFVAMLVRSNSIERQLALGEKQLNLLSTYAAAEKALLFVDDSARLALEQAAYKYGKKGFYSASSPCGSNKDFSYWANDTISPADSCVPKPLRPEGCYPDESIMKSTLVTLFTPALSNFIPAFNDKSAVKIPSDYEPFTISSVNGGTEAVGISKAPVSINMPSIKYEVKPSFRESIPVDAIADGTSIVSTAKQVVRKKEKEARDIIKSVDGVGSLDWDEGFQYNKVSSSCTYLFSTCPCCRTDPCYSRDDDGNCVPEDFYIGEGKLFKTVPYDTLDIPMRVNANKLFGSKHKSFFIYESGKIELKELEYDFAVSWIEDRPKDATTFCVCGAGHPCR